MNDEVLGIAEKGRYPFQEEYQIYNLLEGMQQFQIDILKPGYKIEGRMRLFTHNILQCHVKGCTSNNYPLTLRNIKYNPVPEIQPEKATALISRLLPKLDYPTVKLSLLQCGIDSEGLPSELPENAADDEAFLSNLGRHLMGFDIESGEMVCEGCGHVYPITDGIPNMLLNENEI